MSKNRCFGEYQMPVSESSSVFTCIEWHFSCVQRMVNDAVASTSVRIKIILIMEWLKNNGSLFITGIKGDLVIKLSEISVFSRRVTRASLLNKKWCHFLHSNMKRVDIERFSLISGDSRSLGLISAGSANMSEKFVGWRQYKQSLRFLWVQSFKPPLKVFSAHTTDKPTDKPSGIASNVLIHPILAAFHDYQQSRPNGLT